MTGDGEGGRERDLRARQREKKDLKNTALEAMSLLTSSNAA